MAKLNSTIFKQETIKSWFSGVSTSVNNEVIQPFQNASSVIDKYNQAIQHNSLTQQGWERLLAQSDDSLKAYLTSVKGSTASMTAYNVSLQGSVTGFSKVTSAISQYNTLSASGAVEQSTFATAVSVTNTRLGAYLTGLNGANASLGGYIISLVGATAKTIILKAATIALNTAVTMGASLIISGIVSAISEWINKTENMIQASEDAVEKIKSINDELKNNQKTISDTAKRYSELAQGVDQLTGKNISLSSEDYEDFLNLSNQLAEMFPTLTRNYNDNGDAIVQLSGDVDTIVGSLQNLIEAQRDLINRQIVDELPTVFDGVAAKSDEYEQELSVLESKRDALVKSLGDVQNEEFFTNFMDGFANKWIEISGDNLEVISQMRDDYVKILENANIDYEELTPTYEIKDGVEVPVGFTIKINSSDEEVEKVKTTIDGKIEDLAKTYAKDIETLNEEINATNEKNKANWTSLSSSIYAWLSTDDSFKVMDDTMQATVQNIVNSLDWGSLNFSSWEKAKQYIQDNILSLFNTADGKEIFADIQVMFGFQTQFNNGDITVEQYQTKLQEFLASIESLPPESKKSIMLLFGIETNEDGTTTSSVDTMIANVEKKLKGTEFDDRVGELSLGDLQIAADLEVPDDSIQSWDDLLKKIKEYKAAVAAKDMEPFSKEKMISSINELSEGFEELDKIFSSIKDDDPFDFALLDDKNFKETFSGIEGYAEFIETVADSPNDINKCRSAFDNLVSEWLKSTKILDHVDDSNANVTKSMLKMMGVANAEELVLNALAQRKAELVWANEKVHATTAEEIQALAQEQDITEETADCFYAYYVQKMLAEEAINPSGDIEALNSIIGALGLATSAWQKYYTVKAKMEAISEDAHFEAYDENGGKISKQEVLAQYESLSNIWMDAYQQELQAKYGNIDYSGGNKSAKSSSGSSSKENSDIDWIERRINLIKQRNEELSNELSDTYTRYTGLTKEEIARVNELLSSELQPGSTAVDELITLASKTGMSITELQTRLQDGGLESRQSILEEMIQNQLRVIEEYKKAIPQYRESYETLVQKIPEEYRSKIENGSIDIELVPSNLKTSIDNAQNAYDKMYEMVTSQSEAERQLKDYRGQWHDTFITQLEQETTALENQRSILEAQISYLEASGHIVSASMYEDNIANLEAQSKKQANKLKRLRSKLSDLDPDENTEEYYELQSAIQDCEKSVIELETSAAEARNELLQLPIKHQEIIVGMAQDIVSAIQDYGSEIEAVGGILDESYYQVLIQNGSKVTDELQKQADLIQDTMGEYEVGSDQWNDLYSQLKSVNSEMSSMVTNLKKWNEEMLQLPLDKMNTYSSNLSTVKEALVELQDDYTTVINAVTSAIDDETNRIQEQQEEYQKAIEKQIDTIQDKMDLLDKQNEKLQLQRELEQSLYDLQTANTQKTEKVIRDGQVVYETNADKIRDAQEAVQDAQYNITKNQLQEQMDALNDQLDEYNEKVEEQLDALEKIKDKWSEIAENVEKAQNAAVADQYLGSNWAEKVLSGNDNDIYTLFKGQYENNAEQILAYEKQIESTEKIYSLLNEYLAAYKAGQLSFEATQTSIKALLSQLNKDMTASGNLNNVLSYMQQVTDASGKSVEQVLAGLQADLSESADSLLSSLAEYQKNVGLISEYTSSWQQLTNNVADMLEVLEDVRDNLKSGRYYDDEDDDDDDSSSSSSSGGGSGHNGNYTASDLGYGPANDPDYTSRKSSNIIYVSHTGLETGTVGNTNISNTDDKLRTLGLRKLDPDEYPYILQAGEQVINETQRQTLLNNMRNMMLSGLKVQTNIVPTTDYHGTNINVTIGDINLPDVTNPQEFAVAMRDTISQSFAQNFSKRIR